MYIKRILLIVVLLGLVGGGAFAYMVYNALFSPNTNFSEDEIYLNIPTNSSFLDVRELVAPFLDDLNTFEAVAKRKQYINYVKAGRYRIANGMNNNEIVNSLRSNNIPILVSFNNQETLADLAGRVGEQLEADSLSLLNSFNDTAFIKARGFNEFTSIAPYIPNSYEFFWNTSAEEFRERMLKEYDRFWNKERKASAQAKNLSPQEVISLASIVQKETAKVDERPRVAGVYINRIKRNMRLQADPTVIFAIKRESGNFDTVIKRVLYRDLELDSPYNTYKYAGIPPGPITMPDISAIDAVLNAENHNYFYFVANTKNFGYHVFAETLVQHNRNKAQYVRWLNEQNINR